ncbi:P-loop containing nucleoside triphosphate hydrolase protein [Rhodofomes roseus]|uniref:P-loop containing nucleoside triphosphate hydrolase protein n=1 Tax=Rhodofomes roseus TaxID=34475 RepID=A0ABQ8KEE9_9APHY|nr:P-loop containing nucleoside triphosphate hydrolase protein [Rhodofomes roseus]KAH9835693.1 P-loop containing nucleoside triphosphate hydrolase protein [Rhodofomes roseus]
MGTKKKKTQLKPVARGFATTSMPKKVVPAVDASEDNSSSADLKDIEVQGEASSSSGDVSKSADSAPGQSEQDVDPGLQGFVDKLQDKTEKDIVRTIKAIEQERRFAETMTPLEFDSSLVQRVLNLTMDSEEGREHEPTVDEPAEKALARLAVTYGVLRRLGFSEGTVEECLRSINGVDVDEAFDWLHLHCTDEELQVDSDAQVGGTEASSSKAISVPSTPRTTQHSLPSRSRPVTPTTSVPSSPIRAGFPGRLDANAPVFVPSGLSSPYPSQDNTQVTESGNVTPTSKNGHRSSSSSASWSPTDDPNAAFVQLKMQISELTTHRQPGETRDASFLQHLQRRLEEVKKDYLFDEVDAESQYRIERERADARMLQSKLRGSATAAPLTPLMPTTPTTPRKFKPVQALSPSTADATKADIFDDEESTGGMFELLDEMPTTEVTQSGTTVNVRDMALPKHWSGRTPKSVLAERVHKVDRFAVITYTDISGTSRVKRAKTDIRWSGGKTDTWSMDDIACHDMSQAEQYISTVALHALAFQQSEGFALGATAGTNSQTAFRLLPAIHRDLWDELEKRRLEQDNATNRDIWAKLRSILEPKLKTERENIEKSAKPTSDLKQRHGSRSYKHGSEVDPEQIIASFQARQSSPAYQEMLRQREQLPIAHYRDDIIAALETSQILVLSGETGCGKSTQLPSFILEEHLSKGKHCKILCTEPRRISAISLAQRVSRELGEPAGAVGTAGSIVGYSIRLESNITNKTRLAYVTNGIALRMLEGGSGPGGQGAAFDEITHIIIDEVHERTIESDFLLIVLKSLLLDRPDLKVVLMSATVEAEKISNYFAGTPVLYVPGRTFPVDVRYLEDAVELTKWKVTENSPYARRGYDKFSRSKARNEWSEDAIPADDDDDDTQEKVKLEKRYSTLTANTINLLDERLVPFDLIIRLLERICLEDPAYAAYSSAVLIFMPGMGEIRRLNDLLMEHDAFSSEDRFRIYPLHSTISSEQQGAVFDIPPPGIRKIVIATNIAETGITIPDITCVIDTGKHREMRFDEKRQISRLVETFIAKSNAAQRRGRAGRVQAGLCFHLFTKYRHEKKLAPHPDPEMMRLSLSDLALRIKIMKVKLGTTIEDVLSRALDPPLPVNIQRAVSVLVEVRAMTPLEEITPMGRLLSKLPTDVHLGKFLLIAALFRCLDPALTIAATLNAKSPFITPMGMEQAADRAKMSFRIENSDFLTIHNAFASWRRASANGQAQARKFCKESFLSYQNLQQIEEIRQQYLGYLVDSSFLQVDSAFVRELSRARYSRNRTRFVTVPPDMDACSGNAHLLNAALAAGLYPKILSIDPSTGALKAVSNNQAASFHPTSINFGKRATDFGVNHLCYFTLMQSKKLYAWETGPVDELAMVLLCGETEFKLAANSVYIDRKIKFCFSPKTGVAIKLLRAQLSSLLSTQMRTKPLSESQLLWNDLAMMVLGKVKPEEPGRQLDSITLVVNSR